jgi:hypothetical protein
MSKSVFDPVFIFSKACPDTSVFLINMNMASSIALGNHIEKLIFGVKKMPVALFASCFLISSGNGRCLFCSRKWENAIKCNAAYPEGFKILRISPKRLYRVFWKSCGSF